MSAKYIDLTTGKILPKIMSFAMPILLVNAIEMGFVAIDRIIIGQFIGVDALGGVGACMPIIMFIISVSGGVFIGSLVLVSQSFGAKDYDRLQSITTTSYYLLIVLAFGATVLGYIFASDILIFMDTPKQVLQYATSYIQIYFLGLFGMYGFLSLRGMAQGAGDPITPIYFLIFAVFINIILSIIFVVYLGYGVDGVAYATIFSQFMAFVLSALYYKKINHLVRISLKFSLFKFQILKEILSIGVPSAVHFGVITSFFIILQAFVNSFGANAVSAFSASSQIDAFFVAFFMSMSQALSSFAGQNKGAKNILRMKEGLFSSILFMICFSLVVWIFVVFLGKDLLMLFSDEQFIVDFGYGHLSVVSLFYVVLCVVFCFEGFFEGSGVAIYSMMSAIIMIVSFWISSHFLSQIYGLTGVWYSVGVCQFITLISLVVFYIFGKHYEIK